MSKASDLRIEIEKLLTNENNKLPSERDLSERFQTTRITIREALKLLESEGKIYRANRRGWFASPEKLRYHPALHAQKSFVVVANEQGFTPHSKILRVKRIRANAYLAQQMNMTRGEPLLAIDRVRYLDDRPVLLEKMFIRPEWADGLEKRDLTGSVHRILREEYGLSFGQTEYEITASCLIGDEAEALQATEGTSALHIARSYADDTGAIFEFDIELWRTDALRIQLHSGK